MSAKLASSPIRAVAFSPDSKTILVGLQDGTLRLIDAEKLTPLATMTGHTDSILSVDYSQDGTQAVSGGADTQIIIWDLNQKKLVSKLSGHSDWVLMVAFFGDGKHVMSGSLDKTNKNLGHRGTRRRLVYWIDERVVLCLYIHAMDTRPLSGSDNKTVILDSIP